jgi:hypothetical protein
MRKIFLASSKPPLSKSLECSRMHLSFYLILRSTISLDIQYVFFYLDDAGSCKLHSLTYITPSVRIGSWDISPRLFQPPRTPAPMILFNRSTPCASASHRLLVSAAGSCPQRSSSAPSVLVDTPYYI